MGHLEDIGEHDLKAPNDHHPGGAGECDCPIQEEDAEQPNDGLSGGQGPGHGGPGGEQRPGFQESQTQHGDTEATEAKPEHQHSRVNSLGLPGGEYRK